MHSYGIMEKAHESQNKKKNFMQNQSMPSRIFSKQGESKQKKKLSNVNNNIGTDKKLNTESLDEAMKELLDICKQYNDKLSTKSDALNSVKNSGVVVIPTPNNSTTTTMTNKCDNIDRHNNVINQYQFNAATKSDQSCSLSSSTLVQSQSIERLQQKQGLLQAQLDEVLEVAKSLALRQRRKLNSALEDESSRKQNGSNTQLRKEDDQEEEEEEEEDELIEFQQIENELRVSELNRQLDNIQEELRIRLFKRLQSNSNSTTRPPQQKSSAPPVNNSSSKGHGSHTDESSPSSSCSEEPPTSSSSAAYSVPSSTHTGTNSINLDTNSNHHNQQYAQDKLDYSNKVRVAHSTWQSKTPPPQSPNESQRPMPGTIRADEEFLTSFNQSSASSNVSNNSGPETPTNVQSDIDSAVSNMLEFGASTPTTSRESVRSARKSAFVEPNNVYSNINLNNNYASLASAHMQTSNHPTTNPSYPSATRRNNSANSDLERIEEDEEDCQDYYCDSERFRTIYEEKLSPIIHGNHRQDSLNNRFVSSHSSRNVTSKSLHIEQSSSTAVYSQPPVTAEGHTNRRQIIQTHPGIYADVSLGGSGSTNNDYSLNSFSSGSKTVDASRTNRPLTLYLPKPDEEIDLVDHIQALGHDLSIISSDLKVDSSCAHGYLWKCCSNNNKKWLKRYFHLDRSAQTLSYYDNEAQLVKKNSAPKNSIPFNEISDVYVDHKLSGIGEKDRSSKRKSYVFVLATTKRKYLLASSKAETMRAWIDTLFTAAKANDYFQQLSIMEEERQDNYDDEAFVTGDGMRD